MKIKNRSILPNKLICLVVQAAADFLGTDTECVVVDAYPGKRFHGWACPEGNHIKLGVPATKAEIVGYGVRLNGRAFGLNLFVYAVHEMQHSVDFLNGLKNISWDEKQNLEVRAIAAENIAIDFVAETCPLWLERITEWVEDKHESFCKAN